jgi:mannosyltransferase
LVAAAVGALPSVPLLVLAYQQRVKISRIGSSDDRNLLVFAGHFFGAPLVAAGLICLGLLGLSARRPAVLFSAWALLPAGVLFGIGQVAVSLWLPRYLLFTLPAWVLLAGFTLVRASLPAAAVTLVVVAGLGASSQLAIRQPDGHDLASREAAAIISRNMKPGDGIVYGSENVGALWVPRDVVDRYVPAKRRPTDLLLVHPQRKDGYEFAVESPDVAARLAATRRVWLIRVGAHANPLDDLGNANERPIRERYVLDHVWHPTGLTVALLVNPGN